VIDGTFELSFNGRSFRISGWAAIATLAAVTFACIRLLADGVEWIMRGVGAL
jgi:hypothetical protein